MEVLFVDLDAWGVVSTDALRQGNGRAWLHSRRGGLDFRWADSARSHQLACAEGSLALSEGLPTSCDVGFSAVDVQIIETSWSLKLRNRIGTAASHPFFRLLRHTSF